MTNLQVADEYAIQPLTITSPGDDGDVQSLELIRDSYTPGLDPAYTGLKPGDNTTFSDPRVIKPGFSDLSSYIVSNTPDATATITFFGKALSFTYYDEPAQYGSFSITKDNEAPVQINYASAATFVGRTVTYDTTDYHTLTISVVGTANVSLQSIGIMAAQPGDSVEVERATLELVTNGNTFTADLSSLINTPVVQDLTSNSTSVVPSVAAINDASVYKKGAGVKSIVADKSGNTADGDYSVTAGGLNNTNIGGGSTVSGGLGNNNQGARGTIAGGESNNNFSNYSTISGGWQHIVVGGESTVGGGKGNKIGVIGVIGANAATISGGMNNEVSGDFGSIVGGRFNIIVGPFNFVGGGESHTLNGTYNAVPGGSNNYTGGYGGFIGSGYLNRIEAGSDLSAIGGGSNNRITGYAGFIGAGTNNMVSGNYSAVLGGAFNSANGNYVTIFGGASNVVNGEYGSTDGHGNTVNGYDNHAYGCANCNIPSGTENITLINCQNFTAPAVNNATYFNNMLYTPGVSKQYVDNADAQAVHITGDQTIAGLKTFSDDTYMNYLYTNTIAHKGSGVVDIEANLQVYGNYSGQGTIESTFGGFKFPDGTTQTTAATATVLQNSMTPNTTTAAPTVSAVNAVTGFLAGLTTSVKTNLVNALNGLQSQVNIIGTVIDKLSGQFNSGGGITIGGSDNNNTANKSIVVASDRVDNSQQYVLVAGFNTNYTVPLNTPGGVVAKNYNIVYATRTYDAVGGGTYIPGTSQKALSLGASGGIRVGGVSGVTRLTGSFQIRFPYQAGDMIFKDATLYMAKVDFDSLTTFNPTDWYSLGDINLLDTTVRSAVTSATFTNGEATGIAGSIVGQKFFDINYRYEAMLAGDGTTITWIRTIKG